MPIYEYIRPDGSHVEEMRPIHLRDQMPNGWSRVTVPRRLNVCHYPSDRPPTEQMVRDEVIRGFYEVENQMSTSGIERGTGLKASQIKRIWERPTPVAQEVPNG